MTTKTPGTTTRTRTLHRIFYGTPSTKANNTNKRNNNTEVIDKNTTTNKNNSVKITVNPVKEDNRIGGKPKKSRKSRKSRKTRKNRKSKRKL